MDVHKDLCSPLLFIITKELEGAQISNTSGMIKVSTSMELMFLELHVQKIFDNSRKAPSYVLLFFKKDVKLFL